MHSATTLISKAWSTYKRGLSTYVGIIAVPVLVTLIFVLVFGFETKRDLSMESAFDAFDVLLLLILVVLNILSSIALIKAASDPTMPVTDAYRFALSRFWAILLVTILVGLTVSVGLILLIIPGILFAVWFAFSNIVLIYENKRGTEAMKQSKSYVSGRWWAIFGRFLMLVLVVIAISAVFGFISWIVTAVVGSMVGDIIGILPTLVTAPLSVLFMYYLYLDLKETSGETSTPESPLLQSTNPELADTNVQV